MRAPGGAVNGFFVREPVPADRTGWTTLAQLAADPSARIAAVAEALWTDRRVGASIDLLGVASRIVCPVLATTLARSAVPQLDAQSVWLRHDRPMPMRIAYDVERFSPLTAEAFVASVIDSCLAPLVAGYCRATRLSPLVAWGNVASAVNGAASSLATEPARQLVCELLGVGTLSGAARSLPPRFVRNSCCLYYRVPGGGQCGDCVLRIRSGAP